MEALLNANADPNIESQVCIILQLLCSNVSNGLEIPFIGGMLYSGSFQMKIMVTVCTELMYTTEKCTYIQINRCNKYWSCSQSA